ncbi:hypothetical protein ACLKA6_016861 [Drosophila palustris]
MNSFLILCRSTPTSISLRSRTYVKDCTEVKAKSQPSGVYEVLIPSYSETPFKVRCDSDSHGGGWTVILRRMDGSETFYRTWNTYKNGFGDLEGEFFLGLDKIHALTAASSQELLVVVEDFEGIEKFELYDKFAIGDESHKYALNTLGKASGTAGDSLRNHQGSKFSTFDRDNDNSEYNCAIYLNSPWWYNVCLTYYDKDLIYSHLTGMYKDFGKRTGVNWDTFRGMHYSHKKAVMMLRPRN